MARAPRNLTRFMQGRCTPQEYHEQHAFPGQRCNGCGGPPALRAIVMAPYDEAQKRGMVPPGHVAGPAILKLVVALKGGDGQPVPHVRMSITYSCRMCRRDFERALARAPSWVVVDINRGPDPTNRISV